MLVLTRKLWQYVNAYDSENNLIMRIGVELISGDQVRLSFDNPGDDVTFLRSELVNPNKPIQGRIR